MESRKEHVLHTERHLENISAENESGVNLLTTEVEKKSPTGDLTDEYHYTKSGEFTSEVFKVVLQRLPKNITFGRLRHTLTSILGFTLKKIKYNPSYNYAFLCCKNEEERQRSIELLHNYKLKNNVLICKKAGPAADPYVISRKRKAEENDNAAVKRVKEDDDDENLLPEERILHVVCPYAKYSYDEQIQKKTEAMQEYVQKLTKRLKNDIKGQFSWLDGKRECINLLPIQKSPVVNNYRNKVEFTVGVGPDGKDNTVGFRLGSYKEGSMLIVDPVNCVNCPKQSVIIAKEFQSFFQTLSYPSYNIGSHIGLWQQLFVRAYLTGDVMVIIQLFPSFIKEKNEYDELIKKIKDFVISKETSIKITSLYTSSSSTKNNDIDVYTHVYGEKHAKEKLLGLEFQISPDSFFQVNTAAAEVLYQLIKDWCDNDQENSCVLDICCGTGTIGLCIAHNSTIPVIGVEICQQAVEDAKNNAKLNDVHNAKFVCGPAEKVLHSEIKHINKKTIIAIVDPPRAGLHHNVLSLLRSCDAIQKIIYVSCSPNQAADNFVSLCRPRSKKFQGVPFRINRAIPVDLFPHTPHCELIVEFERIKQAENITTNTNNGSGSNKTSDVINENKPSGDKHLHGNNAPLVVQPTDATGNPVTKTESVEHKEIVPDIKN